MFDVGFSEILLLAVLGLLILGPERLPAVARTLGKWVRRGRRMAREFQHELEKEVDLDTFRDLKKDLDEVSRPLQEAASTLDEGRTILDKKLASEWDANSNRAKAGADIKAVAPTTDKPGTPADG